MRIETSVVIHRPIEEVWAFMTDPFNAPRWRSAQLGVRATSPGPIGVGSTSQVRVVMLGFETRLSVVMTEWDPPHALAFSLVGAGIRSGSIRQTLKATADGIKATRLAELEPGPILKLLWPILGPYLRRKADAADQKLKRLLEADRG